MVTAISRTRTIAAEPQLIWDTLADFGAISSWVDNIDHSCVLQSGDDQGPIGTTRRIQIGRNTVVERIVDFDPPTALAYDIEGLPRQMGKVRNSWKVAPSAPDSTVVTLTTTIEIGSRPAQQLAERAFCRILAKQSDAILDGLAHRLESSRV